MDTVNLKIVGNTEMVRVGGILVPAKIDTGADSTAVWASEIEVVDRKLHFCLFGQKSEFFTGEKLIFEKFRVLILKSSYGDRQMRYVVEMPVEVAGEEILTEVTLANRAKNKYPVLIGRKLLAGRFLVDTSKKNAEIARSQGKSAKMKKLNQELQENPEKFHKKYFGKE